MTKLTDLPVELIEAIMDAAHPMPHGQINSRHVQQPLAAITFGAMRLVCHELNIKVLKRYAETLFSVHTVMLERPSLQALLDLAKNEHLRDALCTLFIDTRTFSSSDDEDVFEDGKTYLNSVLVGRSDDRNEGMFLEVLQAFPNLKEISIEHATNSTGSCIQPRMICLGANAMQKILGKRAPILSTMDYLTRALYTVLSGLGTTKKELSDFRIHIVCRESGRPVGDFIDWGQLEDVTHAAGLTTDYLQSLMNDPEYDGVKSALKGLKYLALPIRGPTLDEDQGYGDIDDWEFGPFDPEILADFISLSPSLEDLTVYFATGNPQAMVDLKTSIPWANLTDLWALELGGAKFDYNELIAGLTALKDTLRYVTLRNVCLASKNEWISLIRFLHTQMSLTDFEIWEPAEENGALCFRNLRNSCYDVYRSWRVKKILPQDFEKYLLDLQTTKLHSAHWACRYRPRS